MKPRLGKPALSNSIAPPNTPFIQEHLGRPGHLIMDDPLLADNAPYRPVEMRDERIFITCHE
jgi:hypothetical protein